MEQALLSITSNEEVVPGIHLMWLEAPGIACSAKPGQFITVRCKDLTLRRPLSIHYVSSHEIALLFRIAGKGTLWLSQRPPGERMDVLGPLGKGFGIPRAESGQSQRLLLVAGGMGIAPLVFLAQQAASQHRITLIHGTGTAAQIYPWTITRTGSSSTNGKRRGVPTVPEGVDFVPVTEDGSAGKTGLVTDVLPGLLDGADLVYACGPVDMYQAMAELSLRAKRSNLKLKACQVSLEVRLGCGFGACYGCTINTRTGLRQVCRDGPVFELGDIIWQEVKLCL